MSEENFKPALVNKIMVEFWVEELVTLLTDKEATKLVEIIFNKVGTTPLINFSNAIKQINISITGQKSIYDIYCSLMMRAKLYHEAVTIENLKHAYILEAGNIFGTSEYFEPFVPNKFLGDEITFERLILLSFKININKIATVFNEQLSKAGIISNTGNKSK